tara:strand:- start:1334 stop:2581 length:1248 start_codon:yes stop_codon:yes gene_type:complete
MKVSIIITNYNYGKYIDRCIRSCLNQNYSVGLNNLNKDYEVIVIDDNSKDDSRERIKRYNEKNFRYIFNSKNIGVAASANKAILRSKGKYFVRVDADDFISMYLINILSYFLEENKIFFGVACDYYYVDKFGLKIKKIQSIENPISCGIMYNKKKFIKNGMYNNKFRHREEEELKIRIGKKYKIYNLPLPLYRYRMHKSNKTKSKDYLQNFKNKILKINLKKKLINKKNNILKNVIAIIPARGNSKRLKNKNTYKINNKPMISYTINAAKESKMIHQIYVSSEDKKILEISKKNKAKIVKRPNYLSGDKVFKIDVIRHALVEIEKKIGKKITLIVSLQANSPEISSQDIDSAIIKLISNNLQEVISVDKNLNSNAAIRIMKRDAVFQKSLSTYLGCVKTNITDIHYKKDLKTLKI